MGRGWCGFEFSWADEDNSSFHTLSLWHYKNSDGDNPLNISEQIF